MSWVYPHDFDWPGYGQSGVPSFHPQVSPRPSEETRGNPVANLIIPDASNPTGWREWWIYAQSAPSPPRKFGL